MKRIVRNLAVSSVALGLAATLSAPAGAESTTNQGTTVYQGTFGGQTYYKPVGCSTVKTVEGSWSVRVVGDKATATVNLFYNGDHHLAYGGEAAGEFVVQPAGGRDVFVIRSDTGGSGTFITMSLSKTGKLSYVVSPYALYGSSCKSLELTGTLG